MKLQDAVKPFVNRIVGKVLKESQAEALAIFVACALTLARSILTDLAVEMKRQGFAATTKGAEASGPLDQQSTHPSERSDEADC